jgi:hypothetical protein
MAKVGFWAIESQVIRFGRDGRWYSDGEEIANPRIALLFSQHIERAEDGTWQLVIGDERARIFVDDTPYVVRRVDGTPLRGFTIELNDGSREDLPTSNLRISDENVLYCPVKGGAFEARFLRPAQAELLGHIAEKNGDFVLPLPGGRSVRLAAA